jgi:hypothetical protein
MTTTYVFSYRTILSENGFLNLLIFAKRSNKSGYCVSLVYDQNHHFGLGPIPKSKPKLANTVTDPQTTFQWENLGTESIGYFFHHKRVLKTKFADKL